MSCGFKKIIITFDYPIKHKLTDHASKHKTLKNNPMKVLVSILFLVSNLTLFAQADKVVGDYALKLGKEDSNIFEYNLTLNADGTFLFHYHSITLKGTPPEVNKYGKGKWTVENNVITFSSDKQKDLDEKYTLDFTNSKAMFVTKSPRDQTDKIVKERIKFFESGVTFMKTINLLKI